MGAIIHHVSLYPSDIFPHFTTRNAFFFIDLCELIELLYFAKY